MDDKKSKPKGKKAYVISSNPLNLEKFVCVTFNRSTIIVIKLEGICNMYEYNTYFNNNDYPC